MERQEKVRNWTRPCLRQLKPYYSAPLDGNPLRLDQNTNLHGPNPCLKDLDAPPVDQYPTRDSDLLLAALAQWHGLPEDRFVVGNGSDEILDLLSKAFLAPGQTMAVPEPSYSLYPFYATLQDARLKQVPLRAKFAIDVDGLLATKANLIVLATPNNPTGNRVPVEDLERLLEAAEGVVVVDEAYIEYAGLRHSLMSRIDEFDNLLVMRTFSKAYGLAGLRIGYLAGNPDLIATLRLVKPPFNLNTYSEAAAVAALEAQEWVDHVVAANEVERERMSLMLARHGLRVYPSDANFLLCQCPVDPGHLLAKLRQQNILARTFSGKSQLEEAIRFTVGTAGHTDLLDQALEAIL